MINSERKFFYYEAFDESDNYISYIAAPDEIKAYELLSSMGLNVIELKKENFFQKRLNKIRGALPKEALIFFFRQLSFALNSGISLQKAISLSSTDFKNIRMNRFISHLLLMLSRGFTFSESLASAPYVLPLVIIEWIKVGEIKGSLNNILEEIASFLEKDYSLKRDIKNQLTYPMIILFMIVGFLILLATYFIPMLENAYLDFGVKLPNSLELFLMISLIFGKLKYVLILTILVLSYLLSNNYKGCKAWAEKNFQLFFLKTTRISKIIKFYYFIPFIRIVGLLVKEGIPITTILLILSNERKSKLYLDSLKGILNSILAGKSLTKAFYDVYFIPKSALQMLVVADESGDLSEACIFLSDYYEKLYQEDIRKIIKLLEPIMILFLGLIVLFLALAFYVPIINSYEQFFNV